MIVNFLIQLNNFYFEKSTPWENLRDSMTVDFPSATKTETGILVSTVTIAGLLRISGQLMKMFNLGCLLQREPSNYEKGSYLCLSRIFGFNKKSTKYFMQVSHLSTNQFYILLICLC